MGQAYRLAELPIHERITTKNAIETIGMTRMWIYVLLST